MPWHIGGFRAATYCINVVSIIWQNLGYQQILLNFLFLPLQNSVRIEESYPTSVKLPFQQTLYGIKVRWWDLAMSSIFRTWIQLLPGTVPCIQQWNEQHAMVRCLELDVSIEGRSVSDAVLGLLKIRSPVVTCSS